MPDVDYRLNALVDADSLGRQRLPELAAIAARNGATILQYRDKTGSTRDMIELARAIRAAIAGTGVPLVMNDRVDVALAAGLDGVHLGREDMLPGDARRLLGAAAIIGLTVKNEADADRALAARADYACIGGVFATLSKNNPDPPVGIDGFARLAARIRTRRPAMPVGAIAGISLETAPRLVEAGADGVAVISAFFGASDPAAASRDFRRAIDEALARRKP
jgi:thiamine-phosphate pyrophosphorylase